MRSKTTIVPAEERQWLHVCSGISLVPAFVPHVVAIRLGLAGGGSALRSKALAPLSRRLPKL